MHIIVTVNKRRRSSINKLYRVDKMFPLSSQKKFWTFTNEQQLTELRLQQNVNYINTHGAEMNVSKYRC